LNRDFTGTLSEVIKTAESEFKKQNKIKRVTADTYLVHIYLGDKERDVPEELVRKYRKL
jgi:hypothetical protein